MYRMVIGGALTVCIIKCTVALIFTALHEMQTRSSDENSVCLSVRRVICDKMEERSVQIFIPYERTFSLVF